MSAPDALPTERLAEIRARLNAHFHPRPERDIATLLTEVERLTRVVAVKQRTADYHGMCGDAETRRADAAEAERDRLRAGIEALIADLSGSFFDPLRARLRAALDAGRNGPTERFEGPVADDGAEVVPESHPRSYGPEIGGNE